MSSEPFHPASPPPDPAPRLPPGPRLPRVLQTAGFMFAGPRFLEACRRRYGPAVTFSTVFDNSFVMVFDPALAKQLFQGSAQQLHAGEANALLGPILGGRSVLLLDGDEHLRHRRLLTPPFHGRRMQVYEEEIRAAADAEIDSWPVGQPFELLPSLQSLTLHVILQAVFGYQPGAAERELRGALRAMVEPLGRPRGLLLMVLLGRLGRFGARRQATRQFESSRDAVDEILYAEIERRRAEPDLAERDDVFSALLVAEDENHERLTPGEVRDELVTLLLAGHETTATGLAWTLDLLLHNPAVLRRARSRMTRAPRLDSEREPASDAECAAGPSDDAYLDAVVKESLRVRPVIPGVGRVVRGAPFRLGQWVIPPGVEINPSIRMIHRRADLYPDPAAFRPERFLGPEAPDTYTWLPFGGGTRRCLGASFALMEMRVVLKRILERTTLRPAGPEPEQVQFRAITLAPKTGVRAVLDQAPRPAPALAPA